MKSMNFSKSIIFVMVVCVLTELIRSQSFQYKLADDGNLSELPNYLDPSSNPKLK
jgi:hypothetical protein